MRVEEKNKPERAIVSKTVLACVCVCVCYFPWSCQQRLEGGERTVSQVNIWGRENYSWSE